MSKRIVLRGDTPVRSMSAPMNSVSGALGPRVYLLSPANFGGRRGQLLLRDAAQFDLAIRLRNEGATLGEIFSFVSPLYFRGKLAYAATFANTPSEFPSTLVITPSRGLARPDTIVNLKDLREITSARVLPHNPRYRDPLERDLAQLSQALGTRGRAILLGSIATNRYIPLLTATLGTRLMVPREFVGLGNMSRGSLLLRCSRAGCELEYVCTADLL